MFEVNTHKNIKANNLLYLLNYNIKAKRKIIAKIAKY